MAAASAQITVSTAPTYLDPPDLTTASTQPANMLIKNKSSVDVGLGNATVSMATGFVLAPGETLAYDGERLYGIVATGTAVVHILASDSNR